MNVWAIILYLLEIGTLIAVLVNLVKPKREPIEFSDGDGVFALVLFALTFVAIYMLAAGSTAEYAVEVGATYAVLTAFALVDLFVTWRRGYATFTPRRMVMASTVSIIDIVLISMLVFPPS